MTDALFLFYLRRRPVILFYLGNLLLPRDLNTLSLLVNVFPLTKRLERLKIITKKANRYVI
jgi:hypothetical protein